MDVQMTPNGPQKPSKNRWKFDAVPGVSQRSQILAKPKENHCFSRVRGLAFGSVSEVFWCPKGLQKSMQIPLDFWMDFGAKREPRWKPKCHQKCIQKSMEKSNRKCTEKLSKTGPQNDTKNPIKGAIKGPPKRTPTRKPFGTHFGAFWEPFWNHFGMVFGCFWFLFLCSSGPHSGDILVSFLKLLGCFFLVVRGPILDTFWYHFWDPSGPFGSHFEAFWEQFWDHFGMVLVAFGFLFPL